MSPCAVLYSIFPGRKFPSSLWLLLRTVYIDKDSISLADRERGREMGRSSFETRERQYWDLREKVRFGRKRQIDRDKVEREGDRERGRRKKEREREKKKGEESKWVSGFSINLFPEKKLFHFLVLFLWDFPDIFAIPSAACANIFNYILTKTKSERVKGLGQDFKRRILGVK